MSRLAEAEAKLNAALDALENAIDTVLAEKADAAPQPTDKAVSGSDGGIDKTKILAEIERIDGQLATALKLITNVQRSDSAEGGTA